jgi:hypothetical protein
MIVPALRPLGRIACKCRIDSEAAAAASAAAAAISNAAAGRRDPEPGSGLPGFNGSMTRDSES